jgi:site-specific recombinase XerD
MRRIRQTRVPGPLAPFADGFRLELEQLGYTPLSQEYKLRQMASLSRWLDQRGLVASDVVGARLAVFLPGLGTERTRPPTLKAMTPLLDWLRAQGVIGADPPTVRGELDDLMDDYCRWMGTGRGLAGRTIGRYEKSARKFLAWRAATAGGGTGTDGLGAQMVSAYLLAEASRGLAPGSLQGRVAELRSLLRFLYLRGLTAEALGEAVPPVPGWKERTVPRRLATGQVKTLLDSCDRTTPTGMRDFAMLMLLARLGLRASEVAGLQLDDLDWRAGELVVRGKARRDDRMPLPPDVGEALATYLAAARPRVESRTVFLTVAAPPRPLLSTTVSQMVWRQCRRAGLSPIRAHRLRHALATELLDVGVTLPEIAQVLRHRDLATTAVYAKVDHTALRELALPWPAVAR